MMCVSGMKLNPLYTRMYMYKLRARIWTHVPILSFHFNVMNASTIYTRYKYELNTSLLHMNSKFHVVIEHFSTTT